MGQSFLMSYTYTSKHEFSAEVTLPPRGKKLFLVGREEQGKKNVDFYKSLEILQSSTLSENILFLSI